MTKLSPDIAEYIQPKALQSILRKAGIHNMETLCDPKTQIPDEILPSALYKAAIENAKNKWNQRTEQSSNDESVANKNIPIIEVRDQPESSKNEKSDAVKRAADRADQAKKLYDFGGILCTILGLLFGGLTAIGSYLASFPFPWELSECRSDAGIRPIIDELSDPRSKKACAENALIKAFLHEPLNATADEVATIFFTLHKGGQAWTIKTQLIKLGQSQGNTVRISPRTTASTPTMHFLSSGYFVRAGGAIEPLTGNNGTGWTTYSGTNAAPGDWVAIVAGYAGDMVPSHDRGSREWIHVEMSDYAVGKATKYRFAVGTSDKAVAFNSWNLIPCARGPSVIGRKQENSSTWQGWSESAGIRDAIWSHLASNLRNEWKPPEFNRPDELLKTGDSEQQERYNREDLEYRKASREWSDLIDGWESTFVYLSTKQAGYPNGMWLLDANEKQIHDVAYTVRWK